MVNTFRIYRHLIPLIKSAANSHQGVVTDLCSGSGGPVPDLAVQSGLEEVSFLLTDRFPAETGILPPNCTYLRQPLSALQPLPHAAGLVTMFNAFHHFNARERKALLKTLILNGRSFMAAELLAPSLTDFMRILVATTLGQLLFAPFVRPFSLKRLVLTYLIPINLITVTWDGLASVSRGLKKSSWDDLRLQAEAWGARARCTRSGRWYAPVTVFICHPPGIPLQTHSNDSAV